MAGALAAGAVATYPLIRCWCCKRLFFKMRLPDSHPDFHRAPPAPRKQAFLKRTRPLFEDRCTHLFKVHSLNLRNQRCRHSKPKLVAVRTFIRNHKAGGLFLIPDRGLRFMFPCKAHSFSRYNSGDEFRIAVCAFLQTTCLKSVRHLSVSSEGARALRVSAYTVFPLFSRKKSCEPSKIRKVRSFFVLSAVLLSDPQNAAGLSL